MKKTVLLLMLNSLCVMNILSQTLNKELIQDIIGNWYEPKSNSWDYGFFEEFVVYDGQFWDYKEIKQGKEGYTLVIQTNDKSIRLFLVPQHGGLSIKNGKAKKSHYHKVNQYLPAFNAVDTSSFVDTKFTRIDTTVIRGYIRNNKSSQPFDVEVSDWRFEEPVTYYADIDSLGRFEMKIPLMNTGEAFFNWERNPIHVVLSPNEKYFFYFDEETKETVFSGDMSRLNNELLIHDAYTDAHAISYNNVDRTLPADVYLSQHIRLLDSLQRRDSTFFALNHYISEKGKYFLRKKNIADIGKMLLQKLFTINDKSEVNNDFLKFTHSLLYEERPHPISLMHGQLDIIDVYMWRLLIPYFSDEEITEFLTSDDELSDLYRFRMAYMSLLSEQTPDPVGKFENIRTYFLRGLVLELNNQLRMKEGKVSLKYEENLKRTEHLKEAKDADTLLKQILEPHKGKVVYIDFWGTWCAPCRQQMEYIPAVKKEMEGKDIVFMYFANSTPVNAWENYIKEKGLEGENVFHYNLDDPQQSAIERRLGVSVFPTYMLVNKKGEMVNMNAPYHSQKDGLIAEIDKLLLE